jgi:MFS family permease
VSTGTIGLIYSGASVLSVMLFLVLPTLLNRFGNVVMTLMLMGGSLVTLGLLGLGDGTILTVASFVIFMTLSPLIYLNIDIFSETLIGKHEGQTGHKRGLALALMSGIALLAPLTISFVVDGGHNLAQLYALSAIVGVIFMLIIVAVFRQFCDPVYEHLRLKRVFLIAWRNHNIRTVMFTHFLLQLFFTWSMIYIPLYLATVIHLPWTSIGFILAAGLFGYLVCEYPIGILADSYWGEKEMMAVGFLILSLAVAGISAFSYPMVWGWMLLMFVTRIGASLVEVTTETYFFKKVAGEDAQLMSLFRLLRPLATIFGALLGTLILMILPFKLIFLVFAFILSIGIFITDYLVDTK